MSFPRYPKYKPSGVEWLGEVPEGWGVDRIKRSVLSSKNGVWGVEPQQDESDIPCVRVADFDRQKFRVELSEPTIRNVVESERVGRVLCKGDLLLEKAGGGELQPVGCVVLYDDERPAVCSNFVARVQVAPGMNASFWRYAHAAAYAVRLNTRSIKQTSGIQNLDGSQYFDERAAFPPLPEQTVIAEFLDRETGKIDELVAEQRRLMELLKEKRQAVISHAVTKGINPHAPMKPSGIEWLGDVPAGWRIVQLRMLAKMIQTGPFGSQLHSDDYVENGIPVINPSNIQYGKIEPDWSCSVTAEDANRLSQHKLIAGDIVFGRRGEMGRCALVSANEVGWICGTGSLNIRLLPEAFSRFISIYLGTEYVREWLKLESVGSTMDNLNTQILGAIKLPLPNLSEQAAIVEFLETELAKFDALTAEAQCAIDLLRERRIALISAAVTGQIDVRQGPE
jgi:type I restriction enzyme S subunit